MRFLVPQFIEVEDKIFGPLSFRQFSYLAGGVGFAVIAYNFLGLLLGILIAAPFAILSVLLAFYKVNNRPFSEFLRSALMYGINRKLYIWMHQNKKKKQKDVLEEIAQTNTVAKPFVPKTSQNKLKDLAWSLDIKESMYETQKQVTQQTNE